MFPVVLNIKLFTNTNDLQAFSSDVWRVSFAADNDGWLTTSGAGHIRFWKMAETFTGFFSFFLSSSSRG